MRSMVRRRRPGRHEQAERSESTESLERACQGSAKLRAERRMGQELEKLPSAQGRRSDFVPDEDEVERPATHADLGLTRKEAAG